MTRAVRISLDLATAVKRARLSAFLREYQAAANFYARSVWNERGALDAATFRRYMGGSLGYRQKMSALKVALETVISTRKAAKTIGRAAHCPVFRRAVRLSNGICKVEAGRGIFDFVLKVSSMSPHEPIVIPFKSHARLNYWLSKPGAKLLDGAIVTDRCAWVYVRLPDAPVKTEGVTVGLDIGYNKLIADSDFMDENSKESVAVCAERSRVHLGSVEHSEPERTTSILFAVVYRGRPRRLSSSKT